VKAARCPILAIVTAYDVDGRVATVTSFNDATARDAVNTVNQIAWAYDDWGNVAQSWQAHDGLVDNDGLNDDDTPSVQYAYDSLARLVTVTYPDGRVVRYDYGTAGEMNDRLSRVEAITNGADTETYAEYSYLGANATWRSGYSASRMALASWIAPAGMAGTRLSWRGAATEWLALTSAQVFSMRPGPHPCPSRRASGPSSFTATCDCFQTSALSRRA